MFIVEEIVRLFELMYPKGGSFDIINDLKNDNNVENSLTMDSFLAWTKGKPGTIAPAAKLQRVLQTNIGGASFWVNLSANRQIHRSPTMRHPKAMKPIRNALRELKAGYAELRVKAEHKKVIKLSEENQQHRNNSDNLLRVLMGVGAQKPRGGKYAADIPMRRPKTTVVASKTPVVAPGGLLIPGAVPTCVPDRSKDGVNPYLDKLADDAEKKIRRSVKRAKKESTRKALLKVSMKAQVTGVHDSNDINISIPPDMGSPGGVTTSPKRDRPMSAKASTKGNGNESPSRKIRPLSASNISPSGTPGRPRSALMTPPREDMLERQASSKRLVGREWNKRG